MKAAIYTRYSPGEDREKSSTTLNQVQMCRAREFGKSSAGNTAADVNSDGIVNIFDLILVAAHFGK